MEKILDSGVYCHKCNCLIKDGDLSAMECGQCEPDLSNLENVEIVMRSKNEVYSALKRLDRACEKICRVDAGMDEI